MIKHLLTFTKSQSIFILHKDEYFKRNFIELQCYFCNDLVNVSKFDNNVNNMVCKNCIPYINDKNKLKIWYNFYLKLKIEYEKR